MKISIRLDDITECMDWPKFLRFKELLDCYGIKPLLGVIPDNKDENITGSSEGAPEDFWEYVRDLQNKGYPIAMHGLNHVYVTKTGGIFPLNVFSEFAGLSYEEQYEALSYGTDIFNERGIKTDMFMAPAHSYDKNTLKALKELGFTKITDGFGKGPYRYMDLTFYPVAFYRKGAARSKKEGYGTLTIHTNTMSDREFDEFKELFESNKESFISYDEYLKAEVKDRGALGMAKEKILVYIKRILSFGKKTLLKISGRS
ncbi:MAG: DUF2334 domain-containing protein [Lachnospiraceae bacterium]|nr:DUF2334 domain-containing protein [Lachnospiraceae bacterium]